MTCRAQANHLVYFQFIVFVVLKFLALHEFVVVSNGPALRLHLKSRLTDALLIFAASSTSVHRLRWFSRWRIRIRIRSGDGRVEH